MPEAARTMPNNNTAEQALLCSMLIDSEKAPTMMIGLSEKYFYIKAHKIIFSAMQELNRRNAPTDFISVCDILEKSGSIEKVGGVSYLSDLCNILPSSANWEYYYSIVTRDATLRALIEMSNSIIEKCYKDDVDGSAAMSFAQSQLLDLYKKLGGESLTPISVGLDQVMQRINDILAGKPIKGVKTGFNNLDKIIGRYQPGQVIVLAARPGCGKTSFAMNIVANIAMKDKEKVIAVFNLEMSIVELVQRFLLSVAEVPYSRIVEEKNNTAQIAKLWANKKEIENTNIFIDESTDTTPQAMLAKLKELKTRKGRLDFVVIDYLQLMADGERRGNDNYQVQVARISRAIKLMAKELEVPIMVLSQTSRDLERRAMNEKEDSTPKMSDLRDSGAIEQDADQIYFLTKQERNENSKCDMIDLHIVKNRSGRTDVKITYAWYGDIVKFTPLEEMAAAEAVSQLSDAEPISEPPVAGVTVDNDAVILGIENAEAAVGENAGSSTEYPGTDWKAEKKQISRSIKINEAETEEE